ncbi:hypothetical protein L6164_026377 [Bauhinia variegata]|uniref:Uncharacterized protein n=1 Tax=Bauhinia variegata TaxID=167791 RepID=A0ACB9LPP7_BAUVA|nr:hypothetical protein L6164_026377 [Bauhinia variegata]
MSSRQPDPSTNDGCHTFQLIHGDGEFNSVGLKDFETKVQLNQNVSYAVVAIIGPQSSGKSTLLNYLFGTNFTTMDSSSGRSQTTQGIWLACPNIESKHFMLVMDIEGTDGSERQGDTTFEKQSGLFALAVANVVMVNIWYTDIGREQGAGKPLLSALLQQIWDSIPTPKGKNISLDEVFEVKFVFLPHYEYQNEDFRKEVLIFQKRLVQYCTAAGDQKLPTSGFSTYAQTIWIDIKGNKNLNLPAHKVTFLFKKAFGGYGGNNTL